jgi:hypothetical protein
VTDKIKPPMHVKKTKHWMPMLKFNSLRKHDTCQLCNIWHHDIQQLCNIWHHNIQQLCNIGIITYNSCATLACATKSYSVGALSSCP